MKKFALMILSFLLCTCFSSVLYSQTYIDTANFTVSAQIRPSDYTQWPDSLGAWKVFATYDLDKNGKKEFLVIADPPTSGAGKLMPSIYRFEATGNNTYALVWSATIPDTNRGSFFYPDLTVADMDGDGNQEIFVAIPASGRDGNPDPNPARVHIFEYDPALKNFPTTATMSTNLQLRDEMRYHCTRILVANTDSDPELELVVTSRSDDYGGIGLGRSLSVLHLIGDISQGFNTFETEFIDSSSVLQGGAVYDLGVVDFDGDGKQEIWVATWDMLSLAIYETTGPNTYALQADINQAAALGDIGFRHGMKFFDANKDGKLEMYSAGITGDGNNPGAVYYIGNVSDVSTLTTASVKQISPAIDGASNGAWSLEGGDVGDIDGDGKVDYFAAGAGPHRNLYRMEYKSGAYDVAASYSWDSVYYARNDSSYNFRNVVIASDLDGDGKKEVLFTNSIARNGKPDASVIILESKVVVQSVKQLSSQIPSAFSLEQNFPNPFNPSSTVRFSVKTEGPVELFITNALGQNVGSLVDGIVAAGTHEVTFNADGLASGTYFYTLKSGNFVETKKMMLLK
jgi:hypothetical protein